MASAKQASESKDYGMKSLKDGSVYFKYEPWMREDDFPPPTSFPKKGRAEDEVLKMVKERAAKNLPLDRFLFLAAIFPDAHPFAKKVFAMPEVMTTGQSALGKRYNPASYEISSECVRLIASLLGTNAEEAGGYINHGGTESNLAAVRLARDLYKKDRPEVVASVNSHYSWSLGCEVTGVKLRVADTDHYLKPKMDQIESLINENTVMLVATAPDVFIGAMDPVEEFAEVAEKHGIHLHVDGAYGGFLFPFLRELGYKVPPFDFTVPQVKSMTADPHKYLVPKPISSFIIRDRDYLKGIPVERTYQSVISGSSRIGASVFAFWALVQHLGLEGYARCLKHDLDLTQQLSDEIEKIEGFERSRLSSIWNLVPWLLITSKKYEMREVVKSLTAKGWYVGQGTLPDEARSPFLRIAIDFTKTWGVLENFLKDFKDTANALRTGS
ncbi:MAG: aminotransferase class V-fold PLP-dependent enzyme [Thaumarchaeota archaeon]|nr:aminotransferase class V-fold PLP-dependent enzyme [Nitrososphaerota archaeon]